MINRMIVGNLIHRPIRSVISMIAVALEVTLILLIVGLSLGILNDTRQRQAGIGADVLVLPPGSSFIVGLTGAPMPISGQGLGLRWQKAANSVAVSLGRMHRLPCTNSGAIPAVWPS